MTLLTAVLERGKPQTLWLFCLSWCLWLSTFFLIYKTVWTNHFHNFTIFFSMPKTSSRVLLTVVCFWLDYSSVKLALLLELKERAWAEVVRQHWLLPAAAGTHQGTGELQALWKPAAAQSEILFHAWNWKSLCFSKVCFSPKGNRYWDFRWHLLTIRVQEMNKTIKTFP